MRSLAEAEAYLRGLLDVERRPDAPASRIGLHAVRALLDRLGSPERGLSVVHVAGSKGKGSTALLVEAVLRAAGERVGTFTSPHLERWTERFRIDGREVEGERLAAAVERLRPHVDALRDAEPRRAPTFFDATTAAALLLFRETAVDRVVLEVGLGGRLDSTNVVDPAVACITTIELEHTDRLGHDVATIAGEKAGIVKPGRPLVVGVLPPPAQAVVEARARELGAPLVRLGRELEVDVLEDDLDGLRLRIRDGGVRVDTRLPLLGTHQAYNAALAVACARRASSCSDAALGDAAARGLSIASLPARIEVLERRPWVLVDAAHTGVSARALVTTLTRIPRRRAHLVLSISAGKDLASILGALLPEVDRVTVTRAEPTRSLAPAEIAEAVRTAASCSKLDLRVIPNPHLAVRAARAELAADELLCITGSVYLAGIARGVLRPRAASPQSTPDGVDPVRAPGASAPHTRAGP